MNRTSLPTTAETVSLHEDRDGSVNARAILIACDVVNCILLLVTLYILACFIAYGLKTKKWKSTGRRSDVNGGLVYTAAVIAVALTVPRYIVDQVICNVSNIDGGSEWCETLMDIGNACYFIALYPIYIFLWLRQKALYGHPAMKKLAGKFISVFSWVTWAALSLAAVGVGLVFVIPKDYDYNRFGCVVRNSVVNASYSDKLSYNGAYYALSGLLVVAQVSLLSLFIYPMLRSNAIQNGRRTSRQCSNISEISEKNVSNASKKRGSRISNYFRQASRKLSTSSNGKSNSLQRIIRRSVFCAALSMLTDLIAMASVAMLIQPTVPRSLTNTVYDISMLVSVLCVLATFEKYRKILTVFCGSKTSPGTERATNSSDDKRKYSDKFHSLSNQSSSV